jgi:hypothetical protein
MRLLLPLGILLLLALACPRSPPVSRPAPLAAWEPGDPAPEIELPEPPRSGPGFRIGSEPGSRAATLSRTIRSPARSSEAAPAPPSPEASAYEPVDSSLLDRVDRAKAETERLLHEMRQRRAVP